MAKVLNEQGQALVEYILLIVVVLSILAGIANVFINPYTQWLKGPLSSYVECLVTSGSLPDSGVCDLESLGEMQANSDGAGGAGQDSDGDGIPDSEDPDSKDGKDDKDGKDGKDGDSSDSANAGGGGGGNVPASGSSFGKNAFGKKRGRKGKRSMQAGGAGADAVPLSVGTRNVSVSEEIIVVGSKSSSGGLFSFGDDKDRPPAPISKTAEKKAQEEGETRRKKSKIPTNDSKKRNLAGSSIEEGWDFGDFFRYLIIGAIIVVIIIFFGAQVMAFKNSAEE